MRLQQLIPPLTPELAQCLQDIGIKTETDLLLAHDPLTIFAKLPAGHGVSLKQFREVLARVAQIAAATPVGGDKLLERETRRHEDIFVDEPELLSGVPEVDALLGGFRSPKVIEISGDAKAGKTALALQVALRHLTRVANSTIHWIDTSGEFSPDRVSQLLEQLNGPHSATALERLQVSLVFDIEAAHEVLESIRQSCSRTSDSTGDHAYGSTDPVTRCIVIDTITALLGPMLSATSSQGHAIMTTFMRQLRAFADSFCLTVIVINGSTRVGPRNPDARNPDAVFETDRKPALGPSFAFMTDATLWLSHRPDTEGGDGTNATTHVAEVLRSRTTRSKRWTQFRITNGLLTSV